MLLKRIARGAEAFVLGREIARSVARGDRGLADVERFLREETAVTIAVTGVGAAATVWVFLKRRELMLLWGLGALMGSGLIEKAVRSILDLEEDETALPVKVQVVDEPKDHDPVVQA